MPEQLTTPAAAVCFGTYGWEWSHWLSSYYPEDLPEDWRAAYYANDAPCVCLPQAQWIGASAGQVGDWCDDLFDAFRFYLALDAGSDPAGLLDPELLGSSAWLARLDAFGPRLAAILCASAGQSERVAEALAKRPVEVLAPDCRPAGEAPRHASIVQNWCSVPPGGAMHAACIEIDAGQKRTWRAVLETLTPYFGTTDSVAIFLRGPRVTPTVVRDFRVTAELMGLA